jgi:hypothetical protein
MNYLKKIVLFVAISFASIGFSQDLNKPGKATVTTNFCITLDEASPIQEHYTVNATSLGWTSELDANKACGFHSNNLVSYSADYKNNLLLIQIHTDRTQGKKDIVWWNEYLNSICK